MTYCCLLTIIPDIIHCSLLELLHIMWLPWRCFWRHCIYIFFSLSKNKQPCGLFFTVFALPIEAGFYYIFIVVSIFIFIFVPPTVWHSVAVLVTIFTFSLEEIAILVVTFLLSGVQCRNLLFLFIIFLCFFSFSYVFQNQHISFLESLDSLFVILMFQDTLTGLYYSGKT